MFQTVDAVDSRGAADRSAIPPSVSGPIARIDFGRSVFIIWQRKLLILGAAGAAVAATIVFIASATPQYTATSQIFIQPNELRVVERGLMAGNQVSEESVVQVESQVRVISSDNVLKRVVAGERLDQDPEFATAMLSAWRRLFLQGVGLGAAGQSTASADPTLTALSELRRQLKVKRAERTYVVDVSVTANCSAKATRIVGAISQAYLAEQTEAKSDAARRVSDSLQSRLSELRERVRNAEERVEAFKSRQDIVGASGVTVIEQQLADLNAQLSRARNREAEAKARSDQIQSLIRSGGNASAIPEAIQSSTIAALRAQYAEIIRRQADLTARLAPSHPFVVDIEAQLQGIRRLINEELNRIAESARNDYLREKANAEALSEKLEVAKRKVMTANEALVTLRELQRDAQTSRTLYESYLTRSRETGELKGLDTNNVRVISMGEPLRRSWPPSDMVLLMSALVVGLGAGTGFAFLRAPAPRAPAPAAMRAMPRPAAPAGMKPLAELPHDGEAVTLTATNAPKSRFAAEIRKLLASLRSSRWGKSSHSVLIVATGEDVHAAKVALNLASIAAPKQKVLLIDGDIRQGTISAIYEQPLKSSFVDVAAGRMSLAEAVVTDRRTKIDLLPLVARSSHLSKKLNMRGMQYAFDQSKSYDLVVVAATVRKGELGASLFGTLVDSIVLVLGAGASGRSLEDVYSALGVEARKIRGSVITDAVAAAA